MIGREFARHERGMRVDEDAAHIDRRNDVAAGRRRRVEIKR